MIFENHIPPPPLDQHIESIFHFKEFMPDYSRERVVPTGHIFLIFELDGIPRNTFFNDTLQPDKTFTGVWISGMQSGCISISAHKHSEMFVIQFKPAGAYPFVHIPLYCLTDKIIPAEVVFGKEILTLRECILSVGTSRKQFRRADKWLKNRFDEIKEPPEELFTILTRFQNEPVSNHIKIIESYPHTQKHLINQFKKYLGITPKVYHRILRFNEILKMIHNEEHISWTAITYNCGYTDQSHFIKDFKHFSGFNPEEFIDFNFHRKQPNFFPLDRRG